MAETKVTTSKMQEETEQQYTAWLLYCEIGSIEKLLQTWDKVGQSLDESWMVFGEKLKQKPSHTTLGNWSKKYRWVERRELKLAEDLEALREKTKKIIRGKKHKIAEAFERIVNKRIKQLKEGEVVTTLDLKQVWEMFQVELGKPSSRGELKVEDQRPLTPEEKEHGKKLHEAINEVLKKQHKQSR